MNKKNLQIFADMYKNLNGLLDNESIKDIFIGFLFLQYLSDNKYQISNKDIQFDHIESLITNNELKITTFIEYLNNIQKSFPTHYQDIFNDTINTLRTLTITTDQISFVINYIIKTISMFEDVNGGLLEQYITYNTTEINKYGTESYTPASINKLLAKIANSFTYQTIMDSTIGYASTIAAVFRTGNKIFGEEINAKVARLGKINLLMHNIPIEDINIVTGDSLLKDSFKNISSDLIISVPPFSVQWNNQLLEGDPRFSMGIPPRSKADFAFLQHNLYHINNKGHALSVMANGVLFRGGKEAKIRKSMIEGGFIDSIISLPARLLLDTSIPVSIIIFSKQPVQNILFINASNDFKKNRRYNELNDKQIDKIAQTFVKRNNVAKYSYLASLDEVRQKNYNLNVSNYIDTYEAPNSIDIKKSVLRLHELQNEEEKLKNEWDLIYNSLLKLVGTR